MKIRHHSASALILPNTQSPQHVLLGIYHDQYATAVFRGHFQFLGGNASGDRSPRATLERELRGEMGEQPEEHEQVTEIIGAEQKQLQKPWKGKLVPKEKRLPFLEEVLYRAEPFTDYLVNIQGEKIGRNAPLIYLSSIFIVRVNQSQFNEIAEEVRNGVSVSNEGPSGVLSLQDLEQGKVRGAWAYDRIFSYITPRPLPFYDWITTQSRGSPRTSYQAYKSAGFEYERDPETSPPRK